INRGAVVVVGVRRPAEEVEERRRRADGEAGELDERLLHVEHVGRSVGVLRGDREVRTQGAVGGLRTGIPGRVTAGTEAVGVRVTVLATLSAANDVRRTAAVGADFDLGTDVTTQLQAGISARDVVEPRAVQA